MILVIGAPCVLLAQGESSQKSDGLKAAQIPEDYFETFPYSKKLLSQQDQAHLDDVYGELGGGMAEYARVIIFGRHGRIFHDANVQAVLEYAKWYKPNPKFSNAMLNDFERKNLDIVRGIESGQHDRVMPGDLRFWQDRSIPQDTVWQATIVELHIMGAEIEAIHGRKFAGEPWLQKYFEDRYWYKASNHYDPKSLNAKEKANIALLAMAEGKKSGKTLVPGALLAYGEKTITDSLLKNLTLYQLRLLRNEIYAIRGARFHTQWIQDHFDGEDWYSPLSKGQKPTLTSLDEKNVARILKREDDLHLALSAKKLRTTELNGMLSDDAGRLKDEIYARRGKVFKDKWLQGYFASMSWYKANPGYSDKLLTTVERANIKTIAKYQRAAIAEERMTEG